MDDLQFVQRCLKKDPQAWNEFVDKYSRLIYNYIYSVAKVKGAFHTTENANDIFQEIFLSLTQNNFKKLRSFKAKNGCSLASWLRVVVVNFTIDYIRRLKITTVSLDEEINEEFSLKDILVDDSISSRDSLLEKERLTHLKDCISELNKEDKYFLELHLNRGVGLEDLKDALRISRSAIDMRKSRIIERLKECFKKKGFALDF